MSKDRRTPIGIESATDRELLAMILSKVNHVEQLLNGGDDSSRGIVVRLDRLEQSEARRAKFVWMALGTSVTALVGALWKMIGVNH